MPIKRPIIRYCILAFLMAITVAYEARYLRDILHGEKVNLPFFWTETASNSLTLVENKAVAAGLREGDRLIAINGLPYSGTAMLGDASEYIRPGETLRVTVDSGDPSNPGEKTVTLVADGNRPPPLDIAADLILHFLLPGVCLALGFWVAFVRPHDPMAWLLLALMLSFPHIVETHKVPGWGPGWREAGMIYHIGLAVVFPIAIFLFGRYFPEPFPPNTRYQRFWRWQWWVFAVPFMVFAVESLIVAVGEMTNYQAVAHIDRYSRPFDRVADALVYLLTGSFFAAIAIKTRLTTSSDAKRRLRLLYWGAIIAFTPALLMSLYARIVGRSITSLVPDWFRVLAIIPLAVFPLTLAYVIVVQKAMGVGVAIRQGLQYALARRGVRALQIVVIAAVSFAVFEILSDPSHGRLIKLGVIGIGIMVVLTIRNLADRLRAWVDRRFFREAYNAEHVLAELSEQVRTMTEPKSLLQTVAARISETLHVPQVAVLLAGGGAYHPAFAMGYGDLPDVSFASSMGTTQVLEKQKEPARVYLNDRDSWLYRESEITDEERSQLARLRSELLLPLAVRDKLLGFISLGPKKSEEPYTGSDVRLLKSVAAQTGLALENAHLMRAIADEVAQRERLNREVEIAREVQERLFPQTLPAIQGLDYAGHCRPALGVGGDYYDFLGLPQGHLGIAIGDVSGKGIAAALMMASLQASLRGEATRAPENLAAAIANINRLVYEASAANRYATFFYGQYDPATHKFDYVNAGHNPPMLFHCAGGKWTVTRLDIGGTVLGLLESFPYEQASVTLATGDILVAFTDGISEAMNAAEEEWGEARLMKTIESCSGQPSQQILQQVFAAADAFVAGARQHDDMTLVVLRVRA